MKLVELKTGDKAEALDTLDDLRKAVEDGDVVAWVAVGIKRDDGTAMWLANIGKAKTNLQMMGAVENLKLHFWNGDIK